MDGYSVQRVIGEGSFGRALVVLCKHTGDQYVLKQIRLPTNQSKRGNSWREAALLSRMKHPNIVTFREEFEADGHLCIVMEYCSAGDLLQRIRQQKDALFSVDHILRWFAQMCAGTKHVHDKKVLHRDLKSKNIFLTANGTIKLGDFGSACVLNSSRAYANTYVGTPYYVSPEIWDNKPYNNKSDVWSLGCVLYELCTLRHPFQASSWKSLILKVCRGAYPPLPSHLPYELHYLLKQMFKTNPKDRPSLSTILTSHRIARLLRAHLPSQATEAWPSARGRRRSGGWSREEGERVVAFLAQKSLITTSSSGDIEAHCESEEPGSARKQWSAVPSDTALRALGDASLLSDSVQSTRQTHTGEQQDARQRRQWDKDPPARLLSLLEKVQLSSAFRTYSINREEGGDNPLVGPLSLPCVDQTDGPEEEVSLDEDRLEPRSDDEDTDFEDECPCDWIEELHNISLEHMKGGSILH